MPIHATGVALGARQADGSLPNINFLRLAAGSHLIDAGVNVGLPYNGLAPELGWLETVPPPPALPGDYNGDHVVDAADYTVWRDKLGTNTNLPNDATPGSVVLGDYDVWKAHYGQQSGSGSSSNTTAAVPEPGSWLIMTIVVLVVVAFGRASLRP
jgi:hypothetical protein